MKTLLDKLPVACAALTLTALAACGGDDLVGHWKGDGLEITILDQEDGKYPFTGSVRVVVRDCALEGDIVESSDGNYAYTYLSSACNFPGEGECILDEEGITLTCTPDNAPKIVLNKLEED